MKNYRVHYLLNDIRHHTDFISGPVQTKEAIRSSAWNAIMKSHAGVTRNEVSIISIEELQVW
jgi:hypothetical protein